MLKMFHDKHDLLERTYILGAVDNLYPVIYHVYTRIGCHYYDMYHNYRHKLLFQTTYLLWQSDTRLSAL